MIRSDWRLTRYVVGLCLPTLVVLALSAYFYIDKIPMIEKSERDRVKAAYRETAVVLRQNPSAFETIKFPKDWKSAGRMAPGRWGFVSAPSKGTACVWYEQGGTAAFTTVDLVAETNFRLLITTFGGCILLVLVVVTVVGLRFFVGYMKSRDDFLAATAHDLTTPLVGMRMMIGRNDDEARQLNERLILIVSNIREFLRLNGRRRDPQMKEVNIGALTREAYQLFAADYEDSESGPVEIQPTNAVVFADETMTLQILWNLFGNDLKYAAPYGKVSVRFAEEKGFVRIEFVDNGLGMTARQRRKAFDRYYRAKTVLESGKGGFGIGLCAAREFARAMKGDLTVRNNFPKGCVFTLSLPPLTARSRI